MKSSKSLKIPLNSSIIPPIKAGYIKEPQKSVANYVTAHTLLSSLSNIYNIPQMFHRHITIFLQRFRIKNYRVYLYIMKNWNAYYRMNFNERLRLAYEKRLETMNLPK